MSTLQVINNVLPSALVSDREVEFELQVPSANLLNTLDILKSHSLTQMRNLVEVTAADIPTNPLRFYLSYFLLSIHYNARVRVSVQTDEMLPVISVTSLFNSAN
jgi:NADH:ubiquinone oxidoreductase subunit C